MSTLGMVLTVIEAIIGVVLIIVILLQSDRAAGLGAKTKQTLSKVLLKNILKF